MSYTIEHMPHGITIRGPIPLGDMMAVAALGTENGYDLVDAAISGHLPGVTMALVNADSGNAWRKELGLESSGTLKPPKKRAPDVPFKVDAKQDDRTILTFVPFVNHELEPYVGAAEGMFEVKGVGRLITIDLTECVTLTGDWSRWIDSVAARYPQTEVLTGDQRHHRESFEARELTHALSRFC
jgi:hypothetical protein